MQKKRNILRILLSFIITYLLIACMLELFTMYTPSKYSMRLVIINYRNDTYEIRVTFVNGTVQDIRDSRDRVIIVRDPIKYIEIKYCNFSYTVYPMHRHTIYLVIFPYNWKPVINSVKSYSVLDENWRNSPWGLEIMVGTEDSYVEESLAGRIFVLFWGYPEEIVSHILDNLNIFDPFARKEIASTALWAAQLVRELKESPVDVLLCCKALNHILPLPLAFISKPILLANAFFVRYVDKYTLYKSILNAIKNVKEYVKIFPEWMQVDEISWIQMCEILEKYTIKPTIPSYVHILITGAFILYLMQTWAIIFTFLIIFLLAPRILTLLHL